MGVMRSRQGQDQDVAWRSGMTETIKTESRWAMQHLLPLLFTSVLTGIGTLGATWLLLVQSMFGDIRDLTDEIAVLRVENAVMQIRMDARYEVSPMATISRVLDAINRPAWCKEFDSERNAFVMMHINTKYEFLYQVTQELFFGKTDIEIFGQDLGQAYLDNDMEVFLNKSFSTVFETVSIGNKTEVKEFWKYYVRTRDGQELVCGIQVSL
jgi:hypothetical protein